MTCPHCEEYVPNGAFCSFCSLPLGGTLSDLFPEAGRVATHAEPLALPPTVAPETAAELARQVIEERHVAEVAAQPPAGGKRLSLLRRRSEKNNVPAASPHGEPELPAVPPLASAETVQVDPGLLSRVQPLAPAPPLIIAAGPEDVAAARTADEDLDDGFDERTMLRPPRIAQVKTRRYLQFSTGLRVPVTGEGVVGRAPHVEDSVTRVVQIADLGRELSRTHFAFGLDGDGVWVMDRSSANGTWAVNWAGVPAGQLIPETRYTLAPGDVFECGGIQITLRVDGEAG
ncbi:FHA domain-containing protein [Leifsonia sp. TF02-11]|uniref:FHA domain-containing protein n=1 Tax=Leifsonia sp. TF02-11 TaxID=2815212 RepID=UPI001AA1AD8A|nr:FHA domain-containing protein [Leifsonia sp. TF02-11]MBO1741032.1 FHA domain-containing protein [Leifsonia sp. TF02-11]